MTIPAHRKIGDELRAHRSKVWIVVAVAAAVVVVAAGATTAVLLTSRGNNGRVAAGQGNGSASGNSSSGGASARKPVPPRPLTVRSVSPAGSAKGIATDRIISITFSQPLAANSPIPTLSPAILGRWSRSGDTLVFHPAAGYIPATKVTVNVPATTRTVEDARTIQLGHAYRSSFSVGTGSVLRLQQLLAELGYLPLSFTRTAKASGATTAAAVTGGALASEPSNVDAISTNPVSGKFVWEYSDAPASLRAQWQVGKYNLITKGAVMAFEGDHNLTVDGVPGPAVWTAVLKAVAQRQTDPRKYSYIMVNEEGTEYLRIWQGGSIVYTTLANTGVPGAATQQGTFAVETHLPSTIMRGTDVDGSSYDVEVQYVAYFNGGDAIHGYPRASYGFPQSNGCVELPIPNAEAVFNSGDDWYGTLVTVS